MEENPHFDVMLHLLHMKMVYSHCKIFPESGDLFGTKRPRVRIPPLRPKEKPRRRKASGALFVSGDLWKSWGKRGKTGGKFAGEKPEGQADQRFRPGGNGGKIPCRPGSARKSRGRWDQYIVVYQLMERRQRTQDMGKQHRRTQDTGNGARGDCTISSGGRAGRGGSGHPEEKNREFFRGGPRP